MVDNLEIAPGIQLRDDEFTLTAIRARGAGGQHVNMTSSAVQLQFDIRASSLAEDHRQRLLRLRDHRIDLSGVITIKAQRFRSQELNRRDAIERLLDLLRQTLTPPKTRRPTAPTRASQRKRLDQKNRRGQLKQLRSRVDD